MGCDIHMFCEVRNNEGKWIFQKNKFKNEYYDSTRPTNDWNTPFVSEPYSGRSYDLFSILADVRNGYGFAGIPTGAGFKPISEPKGVPHDASKEFLERVDDWEGDGHSHSFLTIQEIEEFDWDQITIKRGSITLSEYKKCKEQVTSPESWCGSVSGPNIENITTEYADKIIDNPDISDTGIKFYVDYHWPIKYRDHAKYFLETTVPMLRQLGESKDVRIVFFFDN